MTRFAHPTGKYALSRPQLLLAVLLGSIGLAAWWLHEQSGDKNVVQGARARLPDYIVTNFTALETDSSGRPGRRLRATELRHFASEDVSELDQPRMELFEVEGPPWRARSARGTVFAAGDRIRLSDDVELDRQGDAQTRAMHLETERMDILRAQGVAETDLPVRIRSDGDTLTANGMRLWYNEPTRSTFHGRARIRLAPEQENQP